MSSILRNRFVASLLRSASLLLSGSSMNPEFAGAFQIDKFCQVLCLRGKYFSKPCHHLPPRLKTGRSGRIRTHISRVRSSVLSSIELHSHTVYKRPKEDWVGRYQPSGNWTLVGIIRVIVPDSEYRHLSVCKIDAFPVKLQAHVGRYDGPGGICSRQCSR